MEQETYIPIFVADEAVKRIIIDLIPESKPFFEVMPEYDGERQTVILDPGLVQKAFWEIIQWKKKEINSSLLEELANSGVKYNPADVVLVVQNTDGKLMWLENGNSKAGLDHIIERHAEDFAARGINDIPSFLNDVLATNPIRFGRNDKGLFADYNFIGNKYRVAYGTNGFIVSFYPID